MLQSPSWETNGFEVSQEISRISRNRNVHYRTHKLPPTVSILGQPNPVQITTYDLQEVNPNIIHPSTPRSPQWCLSHRFTYHDPIRPPPHPYAPNARPISFFSFFHPHNSTTVLIFHILQILEKKEEAQWSSTSAGYKLRENLLFI